jgi:hypothetical protein
MWVFISFCTQEMDSTPPATSTSFSPPMIRCAASSIACSLEEQNRLTFNPAVPTPSPAQRGLPGDVLARRAIGIGASQDHVLDQLADLARPRHGMGDGVPGEGGSVVMLNAPFHDFAIGVRAVETMTALLVTPPLIGSLPL